MTAHDMRLAQRPTSSFRSRSGNHALDGADMPQLAKRLMIFTPAAGEISSLLDRARHDIAGLTSDEIVFDAVSHNPDAFWAICGRDRFDLAKPKGDGFLAVLPLNAEGMRKLLDGTLDTRNPDLQYVTRQSEKPAGIYVWAIYARGITAAGIPLVFQKFSTPLYADCDIYARAATQDGSRILEAVGFRKGAEYEDQVSSHLYMFARQSEKCSGSTGLRRNAPKVSVTVARNLEDLARVYSIRGAVYVGEQRCPYDEEFDGNDFSATHLLAYHNEEPAGCVRVRYFADFAKIERLAVKRDSRHEGVASRIVDAAIDLCRRKGYRHFYAHSQKRLLPFWKEHGFLPSETSRDFVFSDVGYLEVFRTTERHEEAIELSSDPYIIIRPEGFWHAPGILESSAKRGASMPVDGRLP